MSRYEHPQYTPNITLTSFGTPLDHLRSRPLWTTLNANANAGTPFIMGTGFQTYVTFWFPTEINVSTDCSTDYDTRSSSGTVVGQKKEDLYFKWSRKNFQPEQAELLRACRYIGRFPRFCCQDGDYFLTVWRVCDSDAVELIVMGTKKKLFLENFAAYSPPWSNAELEGFFRGVSRHRTH